jgi:hypothetical protein
MSLRLTVASDESHGALASACTNQARLLLHQTELSYAMVW